jgi:hypothetical protein
VSRHTPRLPRPGRGSARVGEVPRRVAGPGPGRRTRVR